MSEKLTNTWVLRYSIPSIHLQPKAISNTTKNRATGAWSTLLSTGEIVHRQPLKNDKGDILDSLMPLFLFEQVYIDEIGRDGKKKQNAYMQQAWDLPKSEKGKEFFPTDQWKLMERNSKIIEFLQGHIAVSWKDAAGNERNKNFNVTEKYYFQLMNLDSLQDESANNDLVIAELITEIGSVMKTDRAEFENICYGMQINPSNMGDGELFKLLKNIITKNPKKFQAFMHGDAENRWFNIVINKALRTKGEGEETVITQDEHNNYFANGLLLASSFDSLISYYRSNTEMFEKLEDTLGMKKKEATNLTAEEKEPKKSPGRPKSANSGQ
jgi:hypothetical protein